MMYKKNYEKFLLIHGNIIFSGKIKLRKKRKAKKKSNLNENVNLK